jgi:hypothetical protein
MRNALFPRPVLLGLWLALGLAGIALAHPGPARAAAADTLQFEPVAPLDEPDSEPRLYDHNSLHESDFLSETSWLQPPFRAPLSAAPEAWPLRHPGESDIGVSLDYNRVDEVRVGGTYEAQADFPMAPRVGVRIEYATARRRWLYGAQIEQPLEPGNRLAAGFSLSRRTDHVEMHQVGDLENSLALLFGRQDYRDYFEREGLGGYLALRWPGVTTLSVHARNDRYRSLETYSGIRSWLHRDRTLRANPMIDEGEAHVGAVRFERVRPGEVGFHHWIEFETAGGDLGGDFRYQRLLGDVRNVLRLSPAMTISLRGVAGTTLSGSLPPQRGFAVGGADGLRAHSFSAFRGDQVALGQVEYSAAIGRFRTGDFENGLHAIVFVDAGNAWNNPGHEWDVSGQRFAVDGGFGLSTAEDNLRIYFAKNLHEPDSDFVISARIQRPF